MSECQRCGAKSILFLCNRHVEDLAEMLAGLPRWIRFLGEAALGQARLGDPQRRHRGDEQPMAYNDRAAQLLDTVHTALVFWVRHLCEERGVDTPCLHTDAELCGWLRANVTAIAAGEDALDCLAEVEELITKIERRINRPVPPLLLGPCITDPAPDEILLVRRESGDRETRCNRALAATDRTAREVTCPQCHAQHDVDTIIERLYAQAGNSLMTVRELVDWVLPKLDEPVPQKTLERWIRAGWISVRGNDSHGAQMVQLSDVRAIRRQRPRHAKTVKV